ncbi:MAG: hypothetical protein QXJ65_06295, partial [Acidilobaceae archaeon]
LGWKTGHEITGVVDIDTKILGLDAGEVLGLGERLGVAVSYNIKALKDVLLCTLQGFSSYIGLYLVIS